MKLPQISPLLLITATFSATSAQNLRGRNTAMEPEQLAITNEEPVNANHDESMLQATNFDRELTNSVNLGRFKSNCVGVHPTQDGKCLERCIYPRFRTQTECSTCDCFDLPEDYDEDTVAPKSQPVQTSSNAWTASSTSRTPPTATTSNNNWTAGNNRTPVLGTTTSNAPVTSDVEPKSSNPQQAARVSVNMRPACVGPKPGDEGCRSYCGWNFAQQDYCAACDRNCFN